MPIKFWLPSIFLVKLSTVPVDSFVPFFLGKALADDALEGANALDDRRHMDLTLELHEVVFENALPPVIFGEAAP